MDCEYVIFTSASLSFTTQQWHTAKLSTYQHFIHMPHNTLFYPFCRCALESHKQDVFPFLCITQYYIKQVRPFQNATFLSFLSFSFLFFFFCLVGVRTIVIFLLLLSTLHSCWFYSRTWARTQQIKRTQLYFTFYAGMKWSVKLSDTSKSKLSFFNGKTSFFCRHIEKDGRNRHIAN